MVSKSAESQAVAPTDQVAPAAESQASLDPQQQVLEARGIKKSFGSLQVVKDVDLAVARGEVFGLLGPNGAGKTTLISVLTGILSPDAGNAMICGYDLARETNKIKRVISLVPQDLTMYEDLSGLENLRFFARMYHLSSSQVKQRIAEVLEIVRLADVARRRVKTYSGGMKRRLNLAIGLLNQPRLLFLDEPTVGVDPQSRNHIFECLTQLVKERQMSVFYTTHYMEEAQTLCDRVAIYDHGQIVAQGSPEELIRNTTAPQLVFTLPTLSEKLLAALVRLPAVKGAEYHDSLLSVTATDSLPEAAFATLQLFREQGYEPTDIETREVNLETVFLTLTGKALRE